MAVPFDARALRPAERRWRSRQGPRSPGTGPRPSLSRRTARSCVRPGTSRGAHGSPCAWWPSRTTGARRVVSAEADLYARGFALYPDGRRIAISTADDTIRVIDTERGTRVKLPPSPIVALLGLRWSPDGRSLLLAAAPERGGYGIIRRKRGRRRTDRDAAETLESPRRWAGTGAPARCSPSCGRWAWRRPSCGRTRKGSREPSSPRPGVVSGPMFSRRTVHRLRLRRRREFEVHVRPLSSEGERVTVTASGGRWPVWSRDGRTLFFRRGRSAPGRGGHGGGGGIRFGEERVVLEWDVARLFDVGPDGTFYGVEPVPGPGCRRASKCRRAWFTEVGRLAGPTAAR